MSLHDCLQRFHVCLLSTVVHIVVVFIFLCPHTSTDVNWLTKRLAHLVFIFLDLVVETCNQCCQYFFKFVCKEVVFLHHNVEHNLVTVDLLD